MEEKPEKIEEKSNLEIIEEASGLKENHFVSKGERAFNELTYRGIDWLLNSTAGVAFTYWTVRTHSGQKYFGTPVFNFFEKNLRPYFKHEASLKEGAKWGGNFTSIMVGGFITIPPVMWMESHKADIVKALDEKIYGKDVIENDPKFADAYRKIAEEPSKDFTGGLVTRLASLAPLIAATVVIPKPMDKYLYSPIGNATKWAAEGVGIKPKGLMNRMMLNEDGTKMVSDWDFIHNKIGFDFGLTFLYSFLHEYSYRAYSYVFGKKADGSKNVFTDQVKEELQEAKQEVKQELRLESASRMTTAAPYVAAQPQDKPYEASPEKNNPSRQISGHELAYDAVLDSLKLRSTGHA